MYLHVVNSNYDDAETLSRMYMNSKIQCTPEEEEYDDIDAWFDALDEEDLTDSELYDSPSHYLNHGEPMYGDIIDRTIVNIQCEVYAGGLKAQ
jgi:hypothetical protein